MRNCKFFLLRWFVGLFNSKRFVFFDSFFVSCVFSFLLLFNCWKFWMGICYFFSNFFLVGVCFLKEYDVVFCLINVIFKFCLRICFCVGVKLLCMRCSSVDFLVLFLLIILMIFFCWILVFMFLKIVIFFIL